MIQPLAPIAFLAFGLSFVSRHARKRQLAALRWEEGARIAKAAADYLVLDRFSRAAIEERGSMFAGDRDALRMLIDRHSECLSAALNIERGPK